MIFILIRQFGRESDNARNTCIINQEFIRQTGGKIGSGTGIAGSREWD
jgi:hypothetical protein